MIDSDKLLSRTEPSKRYSDLISEYKDMHKSAEGMFNGRSLVKYIDIIKDYLEKNECKTLIDYGCGKGLLYTDDYELVTEKKKFYKSINKPLPEYWNLTKHALYDPGHEEHSKLPIGLYDAAICTDVLEHVPTSDLTWVLQEICSYAQKMVFLNIACMPALKLLKDGSNAHVSLHSPYDWLQLIAKIIDERTKTKNDLIAYIFFDVYDENKKLVTEGYKIHKRINIVPLTQKDEERGATLIGEEEC